ncbi:MAG: type VI secretion system tube protein Hcp [Nitrososphaera sp.]
MRTPNKVQLASIAAASILAGYIALTAGMQSSPPQSLDIPPVLLAEAAAVDYFLKIEGVDGESTSETHKDWIEIQSFSWGMSNSGSMAAGGGGGAGKASFSSLRLTTDISKASPKLFEACATGKHFPSATLTLVDSEQRGLEFMKVTLSDVIISSYQSAGTSGEFPAESFRLNFAKIEYEYTPQKADGSMDAAVKAGYDLALNKKV